MKVSPKIKINIVISGLLLFLFCAIFLKVYEPVSTTNLGVNILKRFAVETAAGLVRIYDPYLSQRKPAYLGPRSARTNMTETNLDSEFFSLNAIDAQLKGRARLIKCNNKEIIRSRFEFDYQVFDDKKLKILREKYSLDEVISQGRTEFQKQLLLMSWLRRRWNVGESKKILWNFDALNILERALRGERFFCSEYATTYVQLLSSVGMTARYVGLFKGHVVAEAWSNVFDKWIAMDPYFNIYYERFGVPLSALELHNAWISGDYKDILAVRGDYQVPADVAIDKHKFKMIDYYESFYIRMRNDWFTNQYPHWYPKANSIMNAVEWADAKTKNNILVANETSNVNDLYWPLNYVSVVSVRHTLSGSKNKLRLYIETITPNFSMFIIRVDNHSENETAESVVDWELHSGVNTMEMVAVNKFGIKGPVTVIQIDSKTSDSDFVVYSRPDGITTLK